ncbi:unnamed protein product [Prunus brigantina]
MGVGVADYEFIFRMIPTDIPTSGFVKHHAHPDSSDVVSSTMSHDIFVHDYEIGELGFIMIMYLIRLFYMGEYEDEYHLFHYGFS